MSEKQFRITTNPKSNAVAFDEKQKKHYIGIDLEDLLNEQQSIIRRDEMSIKTMMSNMKKLEEEKVELMEDCACQYKQIQKLESENEDLRKVKEVINEILNAPIYEEG